MNLTPKEMARITAETQGRLMADCAASILSTAYQPIECLHGRIVPVRRLVDRLDLGAHVREPFRQ